MRRTDDSGSAPSGRLVLTSEGLVWLGATLLMGLVGWLKSINLVLVLAYLMAILLIANGLLTRIQVRRVTVVRGASLPVYAGETSSVRVTATNESHRPATVSVDDRIGDEATGWLIRRLPGRETTHCSAQCVARARGRFPLELRVGSEFPLGLMRFSRVTPSDSEFVILPAAGEADANGLRHWLLRQAGGDGRSRKVLRRVTTDQADVRGLRPYRPGDPIRGIHWRSSARRGELMVREYDAAPSPELIMVVEPWLPDEPTAMDRANLEAVLSLAVTIARTWSHAFGTRVTVAVAGDPESTRTAIATEADLRVALIPLATVTGGRGFNPLSPRCFDRSLHRAARVVVSSRRNTPYAATLTRSTGRQFVALSPASRPPWYQAPAKTVAPA